MSLFKGYLPTKNKKSLVKFSDAKTLDEVRHLDEYAGLLNDDVVLIDIDSWEQSDILMDIVDDYQLDCRVYQTTRGRHFLFKNNDQITKCSNGIQLACGLTADIKIGSKNSYEVIKFDGQERFIEWDVEKNVSYQEVPNWLLPINTDINLFNLEEGDGRNSALYKYILTLNRYGFTKDESKFTLQLINKYILKDSLSDSELEVIMRDEAFPKEVFFEGRTFLHDRFAHYIVNNYHVVRINGQLHIFRDGVYVPGNKIVETAMIRHIPQMKTAQRVEVYKYIDLIAQEKKVAEANLIAFKNGILDLTTGVLQPYSPEIVITNKIPWNYNPTAYDELTDKTLNNISVDDEEIRALLEECIGYCFYRRNELSKAFILTGEKSNGKSTFLSMVSHVLGENNISSLDLSELDERFSTALMSGMLANIGDDISDEFLQGRSIALFKKIVSGNAIKAEYKGQDAFMYKPYVKLLFSANEIPRTKDKTGSVLRRLVIIPFNALFDKDSPDFDPYIIYKLKSVKAMEYLVRIAVEGLERILENNSFTESVKVKEALDSYEKDNNPILGFLEEDGNIENQVNNVVHKRYKIYCLENGYNPLSLQKFSNEIKRYLGLTTKSTRINGKVTKIYVKP
jgi:putative DNA primase/helicase